MTTTDRDISVLNALIATTIDSVDGYRAAAEDMPNDRLRSTFMERADERDDAAAMLQDRVRALGGDPEDDGTILAGAHRAFMDLKQKVSASDDAAVIAEVERGEDHIKAKYEDALADGEVSPETQAVIQEAYQSVKQGHDQMRDLKHGMSGISTY